MKSVFAFFLLFLSVHATAEPLPQPEGEYGFVGFMVSAKKTYEQVSASADDGKARLKELQSDGYVCEHLQAMKYLCSRQMPVGNTEPDVAVKIALLYEGVKLVFGPVLESPRLISEGDSLQEWLMPQRVQFGDKAYENYRVIESQELTKIFLGAPAEETFILGPRKIEHSTFITVTHSVNSYSRYLVLSHFQ
jgi:hypothetical protein